jgi:ABC-type glutathione transport system ATPase component
MAKDSKVILKVENLGVDFWVEGDWIPAAKNLSYEISGGEVLAIVGESGSGKSASSMARSSWTRLQSDFVKSAEAELL